MPPSNFFARADEDPDGDIEPEGDLESIPEEMLAASIPSRTPTLHYRSRHESLIAFSNDRYYKNRLVTFRAPTVGDSAVRLQRMNGDAFYARGGARTNQAEARAVVAEIVRRMSRSNQPYRAKSIGVVTFNSEQQTLIEDLLDAARRKNPEIEGAFSAEVAEPVFVKNLETVQGDERDVILFSVTYGPDRAGHVTMNFGPLNRQGGERRLTVALTRARHELIVFSSLHTDAIDLSRTRARAVADLRDFLRFAENGRRVLGVGPQGHREDFDSPFERAVAHALGSRGWTVHPQVGVSAYRIDLGVVHPDAPGRYLAGIESAILRVADAVGVMGVGAGFRSANRSVAGRACGALGCRGSAGAVGLAVLGRRAALRPAGASMAGLVGGRDIRRGSARGRGRAAAVSLAASPAVRSSLGRRTGARRRAGSRRSRVG